LGQKDIQQGNENFSEKVTSDETDCIEKKLTQRLINMATFIDRETDGVTILEWILRKQVVYWRPD